MGIRITGINKAIEGFTKFPKVAEKESDRALRATMQDVFEKTQVMVPKETGRLAATGRIEKRVDGASGIGYAIIYGEVGEEPAVDYAAAVHEILTATHVSPTGAKYVEKPLLESVPEFKQSIDEAMQRASARAFK